MITIGQFILENRKKKKLTQPELAVLLANEGINVTNRAISKWEKDERDPSCITFLTLCKILEVENIYEVFFGINPSDPLSSLSDEGKEKVLDYISLLHDTGKYEKKVCEIIPFKRQINIYENAVSAGTGNFITDGPVKIIDITDSSIVPERATFGVLISGDSMLPEYEDGQIAWVEQRDKLEDGEIGVFLLDGESYIKKLKDDEDGVFLISLNPAYKPRPVKNDQELHIFGKVVGKSDADKVPGYR